MERIRQVSYRTALVTLTAGSIPLCSLALDAQVCDPAWTPCTAPRQDDARIQGHAVSAGLNALIAGLTAAGIAVAGKRPIGEAFLGGTAGGLIGYGGKVVAAERWTGAGLVGRQIGGLGGSFVANASEGEPLFQRVTLPVGPVFFRIDPGDPTRVHARLDLPALAHVLYGVLHPAMQIEWNSTLSSGLPVFSDREARSGHGRYVLGAIVLHRPPESDLGPAHYSRVLRHERVHALQHDFSSIVIGERFDRFVLSHVPGADRITGVGHLRLDFLVWGSLAIALPTDAQPWEREAYFLTPD
jgi:hypothetical protein